ncbi:unnamed protein product, partial [Discosporangium mesarthrocarpum]
GIAGNKGERGSTEEDHNAQEDAQEDIQGYVSKADAEYNQERAHRLIWGLGEAPEEQEKEGRLGDSGDTYDNRETDDYKSDIDFDGSEAAVRGCSRGSTEMGVLDPQSTFPALLDSPDGALGQGAPWGVTQEQFMASMDAIAGPVAVEERRSKGQGKEGERRQAR